MLQPICAALGLLTLTTPLLHAQQDESEEIPTEERTEPPRRHVDPEIRLALDWLRRHQRPDGLWAPIEEPACGDATCHLGNTERSVLELSALATSAILSDRIRDEQLFRRTLERASRALLRELEAVPTPRDRGDRAGHFFALLALLDLAEITNRESLRVELEPLLAAVDQQRVERLSANELYAWITLRWVREMVRPQDRRPWEHDEIHAAEALLAAAPQDLDLLALVALTRIFAGETPRSSARLEELAESIGDERCPLLEREAPRTLDATLLRGFVAFQLGGHAFPPWKQARQMPLRASQTREGCARGAWIFGPSGGDTSPEVLESTVLATMILQVYYCYC
jgi:hypothetical protein